MFLRARPATSRRTPDMVLRSHLDIDLSADMSTWWERWPQILEREISALDELGAEAVIDEPAKLAGQLIIQVKHEVDGQQIELRAEYPDSYPYFQPQVYAPELNLSRHQNPLGANLCLLDREGEDWDPGADTLAILIREQFPRLLRIAAGNLSPDEVAEEEAHVGEPLSNHIGGLGSVVCPDQTPPATHSSGRLKLLTPHKNQGNSAVYVISVIRDGSGTSLVESPQWSPEFDHPAHGFWVRLNQRPTLGREAPADDFMRVFREVSPALDEALRRAPVGKVLVAGLLFPDEVSWRQQQEDWLFMAVRVRRRSPGKLPDISQFFLRTDWGGDKAWLQRAPALTPMRKKSALIVGLGTLGSVVAIQLAKSGIRHLELLDRDHLQIGNTIRWALGWQFAGSSKLSALADYITRSYPRTGIGSNNVHIGLPAKLGDRTDYERLQELSASVDLVIDASANYRVSHFLADLCWTIAVPYIWLTTTPGAAGGVVGRVIPATGNGCWHCFQRALADASINLPTDLGEPLLQPGGCSQPTFIGAGLDSDEVSLLAARLAAATLCRGSEGAYADFSWNVGVVNLREIGASLATMWTTYPLSRHPDCLACAPN